MTGDILYSPFNSLAEQQTAEQALECEINTDFAAEDIAADEEQSNDAENILK